MARLWLSAVVLLFLTSACGAGWRREELTPERRLAVRQQVQLWLGGESRVLHAVVIGSDSVSGIPFNQPPDCDSCRVVLPTSAVDSLRLGNQERGALRSIGFGYVALAAAAVVLYFSIDSD